MHYSKVILLESSGKSLWQLDFPVESEDIGLDSLLFLSFSALFQGETATVNVAT